MRAKRVRGQWLSAADALKQAGIPAIELAPKEGLALLNGTQVSTAFALKGLFEAEDLYAAASVTGALTVEAALGSRTPFDPRIHAVRGQPGQIDAGGVYAICWATTAKWACRMPNVAKCKTHIACVANRK